MSEGRLSAYMAELNQRLSAVRAAVRNDPPTVDEILSYEKTQEVERRPPSSPSATDVDSGDASVPFQATCHACGEPVGDDRSEGGERLLCADCAASAGGHPPPETGWKEECRDAVSRQLLSELEKSYPNGLNARQLAARLEEAGFSAQQADKSEVNSRLYGPLKEWLQKEGEAPPYWSLRPVRERSRQPPAMDWRERPLSELSEAILAELREAYPESVTPSELARRVRTRNEALADTDASSVTVKLKGPIYEWVQEEGGDQSYWSLQPASVGRGESGRSDPTPTEVAGEEGPGESDASRPSYKDKELNQAPPEPEGAHSLRSEHKTARNETESNIEYQLCEICVTEKPSSSIVLFRTRKVCQRCFEDIRKSSS